MNKKLIRKMLTAAGGPFTLPGKSQKEVDEINNYNRNKAKGLFKGIISGKVLPTMSNIDSMLGAAYNGWLDTETTAVTGDVPTPGMRNPKLIILGILKVKNITKSLWNNGKLILKNIPYNLENFYRGVSKEAIKDAKTSGIIRSKNPQYQGSPYFSQGKLFWNEDRVIEGTQGPVLWVKASGPHGEYNLLNIINPGEKSVIENGSVPSEVFPYLNGSTKVPTTGFSYWKKHPIIGWRKYSFKQGGYIRKMQTASGGPLQLTPEELKYLEWSKMTPKLKREYRTNRAKTHLLSGPNITNFWEAFQTYIGNRDPENPRLNVGVINVAGTPMSSLSAVSTTSRVMGGPKNVFSLNKLWRMVNKRVGRSLDSEEFSDLISNSSINNIRNAAIESDNNFPIIRITELDANDFINSLRPGLKQGGKMNILEFLKNGSGIHIKKKNRGKFTSYCGGKVTDECILKGKNSSNPAIRKRATFAANARKWKHEDGGVFKAADGAKTNTWLKVGNALNSGWGLFAINGIGSLLLSKQYNKALSDESDIAKAELDKEESQLRDLANYSSEVEANLIMSLTYDPNNPNSNGGDIARSYIKNKLLNHKLFDITLKLNLLRDLIDLQTKQMKDLNNLNTWTSIVLTGLGTLGTYFANKNDNSQKQNTSV